MLQYILSHEQEEQERPLRQDSGEESDPNITVWRSAMSASRGGYVRTGSHECFIRILLQ